MEQELFYFHAVFTNEQSLFLLRDNRERGTSSERRSRIGEETKRRDEELSIAKQKEGLFFWSNVGLIAMLLTSKIPSNAFNLPLISTDHSCVLCTCPF